MYDSQAGQAYGASEPKIEGQPRDLKKNALRLPSLRSTFLSDAQLIVVAGTVTYIVTLCSYNFGLLRHAKAVFYFTVLALAACGMHSYSKGRRQLQQALSGICACAVVLGALAGGYCYDSLGYFSLQFHNLRMYENVLPSDSTAIVADAGRITFATEARLNQAAAVGFAAEDGRMYCAAPVMNTVMFEKQVNFWAVGEDCCKIQGKFTCGAAADPKARGGVVLLEGAGGPFSTTSRDHYDDARRKSQAMFGLTSSPDAVYLRWASPKELQGLTSSYDNKVALFIVITSMLFCGSATAFAWLLAKNRRKAFPGVMDV